MLIFVLLCISCSIVYSYQNIPYLRLSTIYKSRYGIKSKLMMKSSSSSSSLFSSSSSEPSPSSISSVTKPQSTTPDNEKSYILCSACKTAYIADENILRYRPGCKVKCSVCEKEWFQSVDKIAKTDANTVITDMAEEKIADVKRIIADRNWPKYPRYDKYGIFVGNLPYSYEDQDVLELFQDYGLVNLSLVRDEAGQSKGFAFLEVTSKEDADLAVKEMHHFHTDASRKLTVRLQTTDTRRNNRDKSSKDSSVSNSADKSS